MDSEDRELPFGGSLLKDTSKRGHHTRVLLLVLLQATPERDRVHDEQLRPDVPRFLHGRRDHLREQPAREGVLTGQDADVSGPKVEAGDLLA